MTKYNVPGVFVDYRNTAGLQTIGLAISEPFTANVKVAGKQKLVEIQVFERRVLTYTPDNDPTFQVEMSNIGQHYYTWRYTGAPAGNLSPAASTPQASASNVTSIGETGPGAPVPRPPVSLPANLPPPAGTLFVPPTNLTCAALANQEAAQAFLPALPRRSEQSRSRQDVDRLSEQSRPVRPHSGEAAMNGMVGSMRSRGGDTAMVTKIDSARKRLGCVAMLLLLALIAPAAVRADTPLTLKDQAASDRITMGLLVRGYPLVPVMIFDSRLEECARQYEANDTFSSLVDCISSAAAAFNIPFDVVRDAETASGSYRDC